MTVKFVIGVNVSHLVYHGLYTLCGLREPVQIGLQSSYPTLGIPLCKSCVRIARTHGYRIPQINDNNGDDEFPDDEDADPINHPDHYTFGSIEVIDAIEGWNLGYHLGNVIKYVARCDHKGNPIEDLEKALWYLQRELECRDS